MRKNKKLGIIGHARHGKDSVAAFICKHTDLSFKSSSFFCAEKFIYTKLAPLYGYSSVQECYNNRHAHRKEWFDLITEYNEKDLAKLTREILKEHDIYVGCRNFEELYAAKQENLYDYIIWVDASQRLLLEDEESMNLTKEDADYILDNNEDLVKLEIETRQLIEILNL